MSPPPTSVNGSSATGNSSNYTSGACNDPASSVLFDGHIPTLTGLDGDMWASQLLTIQEPSVLILFDSPPQVPTKSQQLLEEIG